MSEFLSDVKSLRERARKNMDQGAVTDSYKADRNQVIKVINDELATELVCVLRYKRRYCMAAKIQAVSLKEELLQHADEE